MFIGLYAALGFAVNGRFSDLTWQDGVGLAIGRWIQLIGLAGTLRRLFTSRADLQVHRG